jgi:hypothetical protein
MLFHMSRIQINVWVYIVLSLDIEKWLFSLSSCVTGWAQNTTFLVFFMCWNPRSADLICNYWRIIVCIVNNYIYVCVCVCVCACECECECACVCVCVCVIQLFTASMVEGLESMTSNPVTSLARVSSPGDAEEGSLVLVQLFRNNG